MDEFYANHKDVDSLRSANYVVLKVNMSSENGNRAFLMQYPKIPGFPHLFVLDTDGHLLQSQSTGDLESGNGYSVDRVREFLTHWKAS
jgi:hypothetical protein